MIDEAFVSKVLHEAAFVHSHVEGEDVRYGVLLLAAELLMEEVDTDIAVLILKHAVAGVY